MFDSMDTTPVGEYVLDSFPGEWGIEDTNGTGVKIIRTTNFTNSGKLNLTDVITREIEMKKVNRKRIMKYDTILERSGGTADNPVGRVVLFEEDDLYLCNNFTQVLRFKDIDPRFAFYSLFYFYQTNKTAIRGMGNKTTGIQNLNMSKYLGIGIPNASVEQQKAFTAIAEQADKSKFMRSKSQFIEMFGSNDCESKPLSDLTSLITKGTTPTSVGFNFEEDGIKYIKAENICEDTSINLNDCMHISQDCHNTLKRSQLQNGDILFSIAGVIGRVGVITKECLPANTNQALAIIRFDTSKEINKEYAKHALLSPFVESQWKMKKRGAAQMNISLKDVGDINIPLPSLAKQEQFCQIADQADKSKLICLLWKHCHCRDVYTK